MVGRNRHRFRYRFEFGDPQLERRELLSATDPTATVAEVAAAPSTPTNVGTTATPDELAALAATSSSSSSNLFNSNGIKIGRTGIHLSPAFKSLLNARLKASANQAFYVIRAFKNFQANYNQITVIPAPPPNSPTLPTLLAGLQNDVDFALTHNIKPSNRPIPASQLVTKPASLAMQSLVPFANMQIAMLGATLSTAPNVPGPNGTTVLANPTYSITIAVNAILNAVAEQSVHPNLFTTPSTFYLNPNVTFNLNFVGAPAKASIGYFVLGPGGKLLPGAPVPANFTVATP
jgi:hypothetical protein